MRWIGPWNLTLNHFIASMCLTSFDWLAILLNRVCPISHIQILRPCLWKNPELIFYPQIKCQIWICLFTNQYMHKGTHQSIHPSIRRYLNKHLLFWFDALYREVFSNRKETSCLPLVRPRFEAGSLRHPLASRPNACSPIDWAIKDQVKNLNSISQAHNEQVCSPLTPLPLALVTYVFVMLIMML